MIKSSAFLFLELIQSAIWQRPAQSQLFDNLSENDWREIMWYADSQKVNAILYDGVLTLPETTRPEKKMLYKLFLQTETTEKLNEKLISELKKLSAEYQKIDCPFILLKGQGNALLYPKPNHRSPGDIDAYLYRKGDYQKANEWAKNRGCKMDAENIHHQSFTYNGVLIENHKDVCYFGIRKYDRLLQEIVKEIVDNNDFVEVNIDGLSVKTLPVSFNAFFIFEHIFHHFMHLGIGLRQFIDWILFMNTHSQKFDKEGFNRLVSSFDLSHAMKIFASVAVKYLGADSAIFPFETDVNGKYVDVVMNDILNGGNFGFEVFKKHSFRNELHRKWHSFCYSTRRIREISGIAPEHINTLPINKIVTNLKILLKK